MFVFVLLSFVRVSFLVMCIVMCSLVVIRVLVRMIAHVFGCCYLFLIIVFVLVL